MTPACPGAAELLELECQARRAGTGLTAAELIGTWKLAVVWPKGRSEAAFSGALLRALAAQLRLAAGADGALQLTNQVQLGALLLSFDGPAQLLGRRPLLQFQFERLVLRWGERLLLQRALPQAAPGRLPFFALIGSGDTGAHRWLAARGRGGGLALWIRLGTLG